MREMLAFLWVVMVVGCMNPLLAADYDLSGCNAGTAIPACCDGIYKCEKDKGHEVMCSELNKIRLPKHAEKCKDPVWKLAEKCKRTPGYDAITAPCLPPDQKKTSGQQGASKVQSTAKSNRNSALSLAAAHSSDDEIGGHIFDFLFAAQDVSTSSLLGAVTLLDSHPDVLAKIREEQDRIRLPGSDARPGFITPELLREMKYTGMEGKEVVRFRPPGSDARVGFITPEQLREMKYTEMVAKEVVRFRPPAPLVPHIAGEEFPIADKYMVPIVFPSVLESSFQGFTEADRFDPEQFNESRQEDLVFKRSFLALGAGPHRCVG